MFKRFTVGLAGLLVVCNGVAAVYNLGISSNGVPVLPTNSAFVQATNLGDILVGMGTNVARQAVGANGLVLTADSSASNGVTWAAAGAGTVMSVGLAATSPLFGVSNSPITVTGDITLTNTYQVSNSVMAGPVSGTNAAPTFRALVAADVPQLAATKTGTGAVDDTEFGYLDGVTSLIQDQLNALAASTNGNLVQPTFGTDDASGSVFWKGTVGAIKETANPAGIYTRTIDLASGRVSYDQAQVYPNLTPSRLLRLDAGGVMTNADVDISDVTGALVANLGGAATNATLRGPVTLHTNSSGADFYLNIAFNDPFWIFGVSEDGVVSNWFSMDKQGVYFPQATASTVPIFGAGGKLGSSAVTATELGYLSGITSRPVTTNAFTTKGDILSFSGLSLTRLPLGGNGQVLSVDNSTTTGLRWLTVGGIGTVTSVGVSGTAEIGVSGSPVTAAGTIVLTNVYQAANTVFAGPASGTNTTPAFRSLVAADMPTGIDATKIADGSVDNTMFQTIATLSLSLPNLDGVATNLSLRGPVTFPITTIQTDGTTNFSVNATNSWLYVACTNDVVITNAVNLPAAGYGTITMVTIDGGGVARKLWFQGAAAATNIHHLGDLKTTVPYLFTNRVMLSFAFGGPSLTNACVGVVKE